jgi:[acyl-carrier-protein] S-malonyltransferase
MAAVLGLSDERVTEVCAEAATGEVLEAVNFNSPGQVVIAGDSAAVERGIAVARAAGAKRAVRLPVSVPSHCALMRPAAERLAEELRQIPVKAPQVPVLHNASAAPAADPAEIRGLLVRQLYSPVRWVETVLRLAEEGCARVLEAGPGKVLAGLTRRIDGRLQSIALGGPEELAAALEVTRDA